MKSQKKPVIRAFGLTDIGAKRKTNEDAFGVNEGFGIFIVADGMGGHEGGEVASRLAVDKVNGFLTNVLNPLDFDDTHVETSVRDIKHIPDLAIDEIFKRSVSFANKTIFDENLKKNSDSFDKSVMMGTTLIAALVRDDKIYIVNIGDSRLYRIRDGNLQQMTVDQSFLEERIQSGEISEAQAKTEKRNKIMACLGTKENVDIVVDISTVRVGDRYIMCSDGLTDGLLDQAKFEAAEKLMKAGDIRGACGGLIPLAIHGGSKDNVTVVIFDVVDLGIKPPGKSWQDDANKDEDTLLPG
ncbi:protein phosphatase 2C domain-containing protein [bacterium]|nr:protein phosphatase 2C domain-containing protein [bacterium]